MGKDPAFLFYSKDWLTDTVEMDARERGVYINLLAYQHINGSIPKDLNRMKKIAMCGEDENFEEIWENIKNKFKLLVNQTDNRTVQRDGYRGADRLVNQRLTKVITERKERSKKNKISGMFATLIRMNTLTKKEMQTLKKQFNVNDFVNIDNDEELTKRLTKWFNETVTISIEDGNGDGNKDKDVKEKKSNYGEHNNILLTENELIKLNDEYGIDKTKAAIDFLSSYKIEKNYKTQSDYLTLRRWVFKAIDEKKSKSKSRMQKTYDDAMEKYGDQI